MVRPFGNSGFPEKKHDINSKGKIRKGGNADGGVKRPKKFLEIPKSVPSHYVESIWYIPRLEEMKRTKAKDQVSTIEKVTNLTVDALTCIIVGRRAYDEIINLPFGATLLTLVKEFQTKHMDPANMALVENGVPAAFPKYMRDTPIKSLCVTEGGAGTAFNSIMKNLIPSWMLPEKVPRQDFVNRLKTNFVKWRENEPIVSEYADRPFALEHLMKLSAQFGSLSAAHAGALVLGISHNLMNFIVLYVFHVLRLFVKVGISPEGVGMFWSIDTYAEAKAEERKMLLERSSEATSQDSPESSSKHKEKKSKRHRHEEKDSDATRDPDEEQSPEKKIKVKKEPDATPTPELPKTVPDVEEVAVPIKPQNVILLESSDEERVEKYKFDLKKVKKEKEFDLRKVKREKGLSATESAKLEMCSHASSVSDKSSAVPAEPLMDFTALMEDIAADTNVQPIYKSVFRMVLKSNQTLQEKNRELVLQNGTLKSILERSGIKTDH